MSDEDTVNINVNDGISSNDAIGGGDAKKEDLREVAMKYLSRYVDPHNKASRPVTEEDLDTVIKDGEVMYNLCRIPVGSAFTGAEAIAHMQIEDKDPLAFFVNKAGEFIINPEIVNTTRHYVDSDEGCMSFPSELKKTVQRFNKIEATFQTLIPGEDQEKPILSKQMKIDVSGMAAKVFQHECGHINGWNIYDEDFVPEGSLQKRTAIDKKQDNE